MRIKKGDTVEMIAGKDSGKQGRVVVARPREHRVVVENLNQVKRHQKPRPVSDSSRMGGTQMIPGGIVERPSAVDVSNVMLVCPVCKQTTRVGIRVKEVKGETVKVRYCKNEGCDQEIDR